MAAYRRVYDLRHPPADCQEPGSAPEPYGRYSSMGYLYLLLEKCEKLRYLCNCITDLRIIRHYDAECVSQNALVVKKFYFKNPRWRTTDRPTLYRPDLRHEISRF